jgi:polysaccharide pyruvyl transferase WcaK-like protein
VQQNFEKLNEMLLVKFRQLEQTKQASRNLIGYIKYYHPMVTQQLISENLLKLDVSRQDEGFLKFQQELYAKLAD